MAGYDADGSGEISYDEIHKMTAEFDIGVEGQNAAVSAVIILGSIRLSVDNAHRRRCCNMLIRKGKVR